MMILTSIFAAGALGAVPPAGCTDSIGERLRAQLTPALDAKARSNQFSGLVVVACKGQPIYSVAYGMANRARAIKISPDTRFNLGSMNKMWTAIAIAQLVEQGKVDVNAPVGRYLPELTNPALRDRVLVRHLLTHTSGLGSYFKRGYLRDRPVLTRASDLLRFFVDDSLEFTPGERLQYSNAGFAVLGMIIERVSGMSYYDYMKKNVLEPAGMTTASFVTLPAPSDAYAIGYASPPGATEPQENTGLVERTSSPAGGAYASAADIVAFSRALWSGKLVPLSRVQEFTTGKVPMGPVKYGYGFGEKVVNGWRSVGHNGGAPGVGVEFESYPEHDVDVVVLTNMDMPEATRVIGLAANIVTGGPAPATVPTTAPASGSGAEGPRMMGPPPELSASDERIAPARAVIQQVLSGDREAADAYLRAHAAPGYTPDAIKSNLDALMTKLPSTPYRNAAVRQGLLPGEVIVEVTVGDETVGYGVVIGSSAPYQVGGVRLLVRRIR